MASKKTGKRGQSPDLFHKCVNGGSGHTGHLTTADNCILYGVANPSGAVYQEVLCQYEMARDDSPRPSEKRPNKKKQKNKRKKHAEPAAAADNTARGPTICEELAPDDPLMQPLCDNLR